VGFRAPCHRLRVPWHRESGNSIHPHRCRERTLQEAFQRPLGKRLLQLLQGIRIFVGGICLGEQLGGADLLMVGVAVMFGEVIGLIETAFLPVDDKLALASMAANPIKLHADCFGSFLLDGVVGNARSSSVVSCNWSWWLWMAEFFECDSQWACFASIVKECCKFGFDSTSEDFAHDVAHAMDGTVVLWSWIGGIWCLGWVLGTVAEVMIPSCA
jgi:hypothetical protein